jgi:hypothetical protein
MSARLDGGGPRAAAISAVSLCADGSTREIIFPLTRKDLRARPGVGIRYYRFLSKY